MPTVNSWWPARAGREDSVSRHRLSLVNISIYLYEFMRAGYQQAIEILNMSNIWTQGRNKAWTESSRSPNDFTPAAHREAICISVDKMVMSY